MPTISAFAPELAGQTGLILKLYSVSDLAAVNGAGDALTESGSIAGLFSANVAETLSGELYGLITTASGSPRREGFLAAGETVLLPNLIRSSEGGGGGPTIVFPTWAKAGERQDGPVLKLRVAEVVPIRATIVDAVNQPIDLRPFAATAKVVISPPAEPYNRIAEVAFTVTGSSFNEANFTLPIEVTRYARQFAWAIRLPGSNRSIADGVLEVSNAPVL